MYKVTLNTLLRYTNFISQRNILKNKKMMYFLNICISIKFTYDTMVILSILKNIICLKNVSKFRSDSDSFKNTINDTVLKCLYKMLVRLQN